MSKPKFYQAVLKPIKNVMEHVYPNYMNMTLTERMGSELAKCPECEEQGIKTKHSSWMLLANESVAVREGGKAYIECLDCGYITHL